MFLAGGFNNMNWRKIEDPGDGHADRYHEYELEKTPRDGERQYCKSVGWKGLKLEEQRLFRKGQLHSYEIDRLHSVEDASRHTGTSVTLARTAKAQHETSVFYLKEAGVEFRRLIKQSASQEQLAAELRKVDTLLQLHTFSEQIIRYLGEKDQAELTSGERKHLQDGNAPNYLETSLMPALAILQQVQAGDRNTEFSSQTTRFIRDQLKRIDCAALACLLAENQAHIMSGLLSTKFNSWEEMTSHIEKPHLE
jgi:hypothetical protein